MAVANNISSVVDPASENFQAVSLWTFVHLRKPRFTSDDARDVVRALAVSPEDDLKDLAKRLTETLATYGITLKHTHALDAAARLVGKESWHDARRQEPTHALKLTSLDNLENDELFVSWAELVPRLQIACDLTLEKTGVKVIELRFGPQYIMVTIPGEQQTENKLASSPQPIFAINPIGNNPKWLQDAPAAFERLRRYLEETDKAVLNGVAVLQLCNQPIPLGHPGIPQPVQPSDSCNAELILLQQDYDLQDGFEIARGDEMSCWSQLELACKEYGTQSISVDDDGAWRYGTHRFVWQLTVIHPHDYIPGLIHHEPGPLVSNKLFHRYKIARRIFSGKVRHYEVTKRLDYLSRPGDRCRVDRHKLLLAMNSVGLTMESYCEEIGVEVPHTAEMDFGLLVSILERLNLPDPNVVIARPTRSELIRLDDDVLLRTLFPRVDQIKYRRVAGLNTAARADLNEAVDDLNASIRMQHLIAAGALAQDEPLPYLVYASDSQDFLSKLDELDLVAYGGVIPLLIKTDGISEKHPGMLPFAFGHALYLLIDHKTGNEE